MLKDRVKRSVLISDRDATLDAVIDRVDCNDHKLMRATIEIIPIRRSGQHNVSRSICVSTRATTITSRALCLGEATFTSHMRNLIQEAWSRRHARQRLDIELSNERTPD